MNTITNKEFCERASNDSETKMIGSEDDGNIVAWDNQDGIMRKAEWDNDEEIWNWKPYNA